MDTSPRIILTWTQIEPNLFRSNIINDHWYEIHSFPCESPNKFHTEGLGYRVYRFHTPVRKNCIARVHMFKTALAMCEAAENNEFVSFQNKGDNESIIVFTKKRD